MAQKSAAVLLADGFEEIEAATVIDVLRRAGVHVHVLGVGARSDAMRTGSHGLSMGVDGRIDDVAAGVWSSVDALVLPAACRVPLTCATTLPCKRISWRTTRAVASWAPSVPRPLRSCPGACSQAGAPPAFRVLKRSS